MGMLTGGDRETPGWGIGQGKIASGNSWLNLSDKVKVTKQNYTFPWGTAGVRTAGIEIKHLVWVRNCCGTSQGRMLACRLAAQALLGLYASRGLQTLLGRCTDGRYRAGYMQGREEGRQICCLLAVHGFSRYPDIHKILHGRTLKNIPALFQTFCK
jgi:hypothetical protein